MTEGELKIIDKVSKKLIKFSNYKEKENYFSLINLKPNRKYKF